MQTRCRYVCVRNWPAHILSLVAAATTLVAVPAFAHAATPPANDDFANATLIDGNSRIYPNREGSTIESGEDWPFMEDLQYPAGSVWYKWIPTWTGSATLHYGQSSYSWALDLTRVCSGDGLTALSCVDRDSTFPYWPDGINFSVTAGTPQYIMIPMVETSTSNVDESQPWFEIDLTPASNDTQADAEPILGSAKTPGMWQSTTQRHTRSGRTVACRRGQRRINLVSLACPYQ